MNISREIKSYRIINNLSQEELAQRLNVTTEDIKGLESGEVMPSDEELKVISKVFDKSVNSLLGSPKQLQCQCCGMLLDDFTISREPDGTFNEDYCKWCYTDGQFKYEDMETLIDFFAEHMSSKDFPPEKIREHMRVTLPTLKYWKNR